MEQLSDQQLQKAKWYLIHKKKIRRYFLIILILLNLIFWGITAFQVFKYFNFAKEYEKCLYDLSRQNIDYLFLNQHFKPNDLKFNSLNFWLTSISEFEEKQHYDFEISTQNPNDNWLAKVSYNFQWSEAKTKSKTDFILPGQQKSFLLLGQETDNYILNPDFYISNIVWKRIKPNNFQNKILDELEIVNLASSYEVSLEKMVTVPKISFEIENHSIYSFWQINFQIMAYQGNKLAGTNFFSIEKCLTGEKRKIEILWPKIPENDRIGVILDLNPFDKTNFIPAY